MASKKIQIPDINQYSQFRPFLDDFFKLNKESQKSFSFRFLAKKLGWSPSHLNDVMQGRRFLSLNTILELIEYLNLKGVRAERLLLLALFESNGIGEKGKDFLALKNSSLNVKTMAEGEAQLLSSVRLQQVLHYLICRDGIWDAADFIARSRKADKISKTELSKTIQQLEQAGLILWNKVDAKFTILKTEFYEDTKNPVGIFQTAQREFANSYLDFIDEPFPSWTDLFGSVTIPRERLPEVFDRLAGLRNYLYEIRNQSLEKDPKTKFEVFQFSISLFSVFKR